MLSWSCRRFRARFAPGSGHPHRRGCRDCAAFAAALEAAAGARLPLPAGLRRELRELAAPAAPAAGAILPFPVPRLHLPAELAAGLRRLARPATTPPEWLRSPRYAIAASALLAMLLGPLLPAAADRSLQAVGNLRDEVSPFLQRTGAGGRGEIDKLRSGVGDAVGAAAQSLRHLDAGAAGLSRRLSAFTQHEPTRTRQGDPDESR